MTDDQWHREFQREAGRQDVPLQELIAYTNDQLLRIPGFGLRRLQAFRRLYGGEQAEPDSYAAWKAMNAPPAAYPLGTSLHAAERARLDAETIERLTARVLAAEARIAALEREARENGLGERG